MTAIPKPSEKEGKLTLSRAERAAKRFDLAEKAGWRCPNCATIMTRYPGYWNSVELDHIKPQPMGCAKDDSDDNLQVLCHGCNTAKGSKR